MLLDFVVLFGCIVVIRVEIWFVKTLSGWARSDADCKGAGLHWALTWVWELKGQSREGVVTPAPSDAKDTKWVSSPKMLPSEAGIAPAVDP